MIPKILPILFWDGKIYSVLYPLCKSLNFHKDTAGSSAQVPREKWDYWEERNATYHLILLHCVEQTPWGVSEHSETIIAPPAIDNEWKRNIS